ncbi:MAG: tRNA (guanosine(46)-N7)-methyltransferase TrmB [Gammaproteobacteria bacterium]
MASSDQKIPVRPIIRREIKSFVRREGRITQAQTDAIETLWPKYGLEKQDLLKLDQTFDRKAPRFLEIGCGIGDAIISLAKNNPDNDYIGIEVYFPGLGTILQKIDQHNLSNVRLVRDDAMECLRETIPDRSLDGVMVFFPDPWPKKRHNKRRLIQPKSLSLLAKKLKRHGRLFIGTDWQDYADHIINITKDCDALINLAGSEIYAPRPSWRQLTRYEKRGLRLGHKVRDFVYSAC